MSNARDEYIATGIAPSERKMYDENMNASHYQVGYLNLQDIQEAIGVYLPDVYIATCQKYIFRHRKKGKPIEDLKKAKWYLDRTIELMEQEEFAENEQTIST